MIAQRGYVLRSGGAQKCQMKNDRKRSAQKGIERRGTVWGEAVAHILLAAKEVGARACIDGRFHRIVP